MSYSHLHPDSRPVLRIFSCEPTMPHEEPVDPSGVTPQSTLRELYEKAFVPIWIDGQGLSPKTKTLYMDALNWWERLTDNPPLDQIDDFEGSRFVARLLKAEGKRKGETLSIATVRKHCTALNTLLAFAGPKTRDGRGRKNRELVSFPAFLDKPRADHEAPDGDFSLCELHALYWACDRMRSPRVAGVSPADWWRAFLVVSYYTGLRVGQVMRLQWDDLTPPTIMVWARNSKGRRGKRQYLAPLALEALERIRTDRQRIFEFPNWDQNPRWHQDLFKRLARHAGLPPARQFGFHGLRKLHATQLAEVEIAASDGVQAAQLSLGHSSRGVTAGHYVNGRVQDRIIAAAIDRLPSPIPPADFQPAPPQVA